MFPSALPLLLFILLWNPLYAQKVIVVVIDGARYSESFGSGSAYLTRIWSALRPAGTIWTNFRNEGLTQTNPGHASIATGTWQSIANDGTGRPTTPTIFEYFRKAIGAPAQDAYVVVGKNKLDVLAYGNHPDYGVAYGASVSVAARDTGVLNRVRSIMNTNHPRLLMVNLADVDSTGHTGNWMSYLKALHIADSVTYEIWKAVNDDPFYRDSTTIFVTNDHGRHDDAHGGFKNHGDGCEGCRHIMLLAVGRGFPSGRVVARTRTQRDVAPTVGILLGFPTPLAEGESLLADTGDVTEVEDSQGSLFFPALEQNYPNPFNPSTVIPFSLKRDSFITLRVFNVLGEEIVTPSRRFMTAGSHSVVFDATPYPSGMYLYTLEAGGFLATRRMTLTR